MGRGQGSSSGGGEGELIPWGRAAARVGEVRASSGRGKAPTVFCYGHFDVQPPAPL